MVVDKLKLLLNITEVDGNITHNLVSWMHTDTPVIYSLHVHKEYRNMGICKAMVNYWEKEILNRVGNHKNCVYLSVSLKNTMLKTYEKWGYALTGNKVIGGNKDDEWMIKNLI
jgi:ribosomal protein S18 acetylase RimI-like enzyme